MSVSGANQVDSTISPAQVRYIKLGREGKWEKECVEKGIIRFGFGCGKADRFPLCRAGRWDELAELWIKKGRSKGKATEIANQARFFFEDDGSTLWITFVSERLYWGFLESTPPERDDDGDSVWRSVAGGWRWTDLNGEQLTKDRLSGALTQLAAYRGTSCKVDAKDYAVHRINGQKTPEVERAVIALKETKNAVRELMTLLGPRDFEMLVDLVFSTSGWRRQGIVGGTQKTLDLDLTLPSTGERALVQVKAKTTSDELADYVKRFDELGFYKRMFYVFHSGEAKTDDDRVIVIGPDQLADLVLDAGLVSWLVRKVS